MGEVWFVTGGARSGKSRYAERLAARTELPVVFVATMEALDDELAARVARHRAERPRAWRTIEAPTNVTLAAQEAQGSACLLIDCLSLWVANRLLVLGERPLPSELEALEATLDTEIDALVEVMRERLGPTILVSNEVGAGIVPEYALGRAYRDMLGRVNQRAAASAARAWLLVAGRAVELPASESD